MTDDLPSSATTSDLFRFVAQATGDAIVVVGPEGRIEWCNAALARLVGRPHAHLSGSAARSLFPEAKRGRFGDALARATAGEEVEKELEALATADGQSVPVAVSLAPLESDGRRCVAIHCRDISELATAQETLADLQTRVRTTEQLAGIGAWVWDVTTGSVQWSEGMHDLMGVNPLEFAGTLEAHLAVVDPSRREELGAAMTAAVESSDGSLELECPIVRPDGSHSWIWFQGAVVRGAGSHALGLRGIAQDLTERQAALAALVEADQLKDEFLATVSHELRTPLTVILGFSEHLMDLTDDSIRPYLEAVDRNAHQMHQMVERLLDFSRLQAGRIVLAPRVEPLRPLVDHAIRSIEPLLRERSADVQLDVETDLKARVDPEAFTRVLVNLITNAAKFSEKDRPIMVAGRAGEGHVEVSVTDQGIGIHPDQHDAIFERFVQLADTPPAGGRGAGVGLSIVARYVDLHGGRVWVDSQPGQGSTFTFTLPSERAGR